MKKEIKKCCRETVEKLLERIELEDKGTTIEVPVNQDNLLDKRELYNMSTQVTASYKKGYNQAVADLENLKSCYFNDKKLK